MLYLLLLTIPLQLLAKPLYTLDLEYQYANQVRQQAYSKYDDGNYGAQPFQSLRLSSLWDLGQTQRAHYFWDAQLQYIDLLQTTIGTLSVVERYSQSGVQRLRYYGLDYSNFDQLSFMQLVLGQQGRLFGLPSRTHLSLPFGGTQAATSNTIAAMPGIEQLLVMQYRQYAIELSAGYYARKDARDPISAIGMTLVYQFSQFLESGVGYQFFSGLGNDNTSGVLIYLRAPLVYTPAYKQGALSRFSLDNVRRPLGALVQAIN